MVVVTEMPFCDLMEKKDVYNKSFENSLLLGLERFIYRLLDEKSIVPTSFVRYETIFPSDYIL